MTQFPPAPHPEDGSAQVPAHGTPYDPPAPADGTPYDPPAPADGQAPPADPFGSATQGAPRETDPQPSATGAPQAASPYATSGSAYGAPQPAGSAPAQPSPYAGSAPSAASASAAPQGSWGGAAPAAGSPAPSSQPSAGAGAQRAGFFTALFDFRFEHFITLKFAGVLYILSWIVAALIWLWNIVSALIAGFVFATDNYYGGSDFTPWPLIVAILFGWIPSVLAILGLRLVLEFSVATIRTAENTTVIAQRAGAGTADD